MSLQDYAGADASVSWSTAVALPVLETAIMGADGRIIGTWASRECESNSFNTKCVRLIITQAAEDRVEGQLVYIPVNGTTGAPAFAPAVDPDRGYPVGLDPAEYEKLYLNPVPNLTYRMLDGRFENDVLTFRRLLFDLWWDWCSLQTPYPWHAQGHEFYYCVPQDPAAQAAIDRAKVVLCTSSVFEPFCVSDELGPGPCACTNDPSSENCRQAQCRCDSSHCQVDSSVYGFTDSRRLVLKNDRLVDPDYEWKDTGLERVGP